MTIVKSIVVTVSFFIIATLSDLIILSFDNNISIYPHVVGLSEIIPGLISYGLIIAYFRFSKIQVALNKVSVINNYQALVLILIILAIGDYLFDLPFFEWKNLSNEYFNTEFKITVYSHYEFSSFQLYRAFSVLLVAPIFEEIFFRYYIFGGLIKKYSFRTAILTSSILFAAIHIVSPRNLIPAFVFGLISSMVYYRTQKISLSILLHFLRNAIWFAAVLLAEEYVSLINEIGFGLSFWLIFLIGVVLIVTGLRRISTATSAFFPDESPPNLKNDQS